MSVKFMIGLVKIRLIELIIHLSFYPYHTSRDFSTNKFSVAEIRLFYLLTGQILVLKFLTLTIIRFIWSMISYEVDFRWNSSILAFRFHTLVLWSVLFVSI